MMRNNPRTKSGGLTLIELLIAAGILGILLSIGIPAYTGFVQRARETALICYLGSLHKAQIGLRTETDANGFTGDFDELEETGYIAGGDNAVPVRRRMPRRGGTRTTSSRMVYTYRLDLVAREDASGNTSYSVLAYPQSRSASSRWFYMDQTGLIRAGIGSAGPFSAPAT